MPRASKDYIRRGNKYSFRIRVPQDLIEHIGRKEIKKSLGTSNATEAARLARSERNRHEEEWDQIRAQIKKHKRAVDDLTESQIWYLATRYFVTELQRNSESIPSDTYTITDAEQDLWHLSQWDDVAGSLLKAAKQLLEEAQIELPARPNNKATPTGFIKLQRLIQSAMIEAHKRMMLTTFPTYTTELDPRFKEVTENTKLKKHTSTTLNELISAFEKDPSRRKPGTKTKLKHDAQFRIMREFFGEHVRIDSITRDDTRDFRALLQRLPKNAQKHYPNLDVKKAADAGQRDGLPTMAPQTANDYIRALDAMMRYAVNEGWLSNNPASGLLLAQANSPLKDRRYPFSVEDLTRIFAAPIYTGCVNDKRGYAKPGPSKPRRGRFWVPLIALYTGMRLNEICQLTLDDIARIDNTDVILIRGDEDDETKRVKTDAGNRFVPVHSELKRIGFKLFVEAMRRTNAQDAPLFPDLPIGSTGYRSDPFSKFFAGFQKHVRVKEKKKAFHSFRHSFRDALREADLSPERVRALGGWSSGRTEDTYGSGLKASTLAKDIEKVEFVGLDLSHLHYHQK